MMSRVTAALLMVQVLFGLWHVAGSVVLEHVSPSALIGFRVFLAAPLLLVMARVWEKPLPTKKDFIHLTILGAIAVPANQLLYAEGLHRAGPINTSVLLLLAPVLTLVMAVLSGQERVNWKKNLGVALAIIGALGLAEFDKFDTAPEKTLGNLLVMLNATAYGLYLVGARSVFLRVGFLPGVAWVFFLGAILSLPWTGPGIVETSWTSLPDNILWVLLFVLLGPTIGTYGLNAYALEKGPSSLVGIFITLQPIIAIGASWLLLSLTPSPRSMLWTIPIVAGVALCTLVKTNTSPPQTSCSPSEPGEADG